MATKVLPRARKVALRDEAHPFIQSPKKHPHPHFSLFSTAAVFSGSFFSIPRRLLKSGVPPLSSQACATAVCMRVSVFARGHGCAKPGPRLLPARSPRPEACECALPSRGVSEISEIRGSSAVPLSTPVRGAYKNVKIWEATLVSEGPRGALGKQPKQRILFLTRPVPNKTAFPFLTKQASRC